MWAESWTHRKLILMQKGKRPRVRYATTTLELLI